MIFDCTSRALASSPSSCPAKAFELWQFLSWSFQCLKSGAGLKPFTKSLWVVVMCKSPGQTWVQVLWAGGPLAVTTKLLKEQLTHNSWPTWTPSGMTKSFSLWWVVSIKITDFIDLTEKLQPYPKRCSNCPDCFADLLNTIPLFKRPSTQFRLLR